MNQAVDLSILIVNWNTPELLTRCLRAVDETVRSDARIRLETLVVDNGSSDDSAARVRTEFPWVRLIVNQHNLGFAGANNQAIQASRGEFILLLNSDAFLQGDAAQRLLFAMQNQPRIGIAGPALVYPDGRPQPSHGPLPGLRSEVLSLFGLDKRQPLTGVDAAWFETGMVSGACLMARRAVLDQIGLLDERFFMFSEEVDLCLRAHQAGWQVVHLPQVQVIHIGGGSTETSARRLGMLYQAKLQYFAKHQGGASRQALHLAMWISILFKMLRSGLVWLISLGRTRRGPSYLRLAKEFARASVR